MVSPLTPRAARPVAAEGCWVPGLMEGKEGGAAPMPMRGLPGTGGICVTHVLRWDALGEGTLHRPSLQEAIGPVLRMILVRGLFSGASRTS